MADPSYVLVGDRPHVIDEWQRVPAIWDTVRHAVDDLAGEKGAWILTGSSTPQKEQVAHSDAGRIGRIRMHPMTLAEMGKSTAQVSLAGLFEDQFEPCACESGIEDLVQLVVRGGWPDERLSDSRDVLIVVRDYLESVFTQSVVQLGESEELSRRTANSLARNLGQFAKIGTLVRDVYAYDADDEILQSDRKTVAACVNTLCRLYLIDEVPGWVPASRSPKRMRVKPKRYFADPSLPVALLGLSPEALLQDWQTFGLVFENLVMRDLDVYARALDYTLANPVRYYHDDSGLEVDVIIERVDGRWAAVEITVSPDKVDEAAENLRGMSDKVCSNERAGMRKPSFLAVITGVGEVAYRRSDGVYVIPIRALGA
nr:DUF4143 domain-containing protein [Collinsella urealyticum]